MNRRFLKIFSAIFVFFLLSVFFSPLFSFAYTFSRNLSQGSSGDDVLNLQKILNVQPQTGYFGPLTKKAVISFQEQYRNDILVPAGLAAGNGFVGALTRAKLSLPATLTSTNTTNNSLSTPAVATTTPVAGILSALGAFGPAPRNTVIVDSVSTFIIKAGDSLYLQGRGFTNLNSVYFSSATHIDNLISTTTHDLVVRVPSLSNGLYQVWVLNTNGSSEKKAKFFIKVSDQTISRPTITSVTPVNAKMTDTITVTGSGFDFQGNQINSLLGLVKNVSSDGTHISFKVSDLPNARAFATSSVTTFNVSFSISTTKGRTNNYGIFKLTK